MSDTTELWELPGEMSPADRLSVESILHHAGGKKVVLPSFLANGVRDYSYELGPAECGWDYDYEAEEDTFPIEMWKVWVNGDPAEYREDGEVSNETP